ncbi:MAG: urease accessory protein UreF [Proteobacteria bacterium]|nr:urease accessory protein UreF [Pseudomonadota bacterium]
MTPDAATLITALRLGDSQFPSGAFGFSWGLEVLWREHRLRPGSLLAVVEAELEGRWAVSDRVFISLAMAAADREALRIIDDEADAMAWPAAYRDGACRAGAGLLASHVRLGTPGAAALQQDRRNGGLRGHLPVIQGALFAALGFDVRLALGLAGYGFVAGLGGAAMRLGMAGAFEVQQTIAAVTPRLAALTEGPLPETATSFSPLSDIAMMRRGAAGAGLFAN